MKLDRHWRGWRRIERVALWTTLAASTLVAVQPLRERLSAWQNQRALNAQWQQAIEREHAASHEQSASREHAAAKAAPTSQLRAEKHLSSWRHPKIAARTKIATKLEVETKEAKPEAKSKESQAKTQEARTKTKNGASQEEGDTAIHGKSQEEDTSLLWPLTRLSSPQMKLDAVVVQGTSDSQLKRGPGHEVDTSLPGGPNCVIAAHRNAYGWWFYRLNDLHPGDFVVLQEPGLKFLYRVAVSRVVSVHDTSILNAPLGAAPRLTLYSCTLPKTERRLVVIANLTSSQAT